MCFVLPSAVLDPRPNGVRYPRVDGRADALSKRKKLKARKTPKNAARTHSQVRAVLARCRIE